MPPVPPTCHRINAGQYHSQQHSTSHSGAILPRCGFRRISPFVRNAGAKAGRRAQRSMHTQTGRKRKHIVWKQFYSLLAMVCLCVIVSGCTAQDQPAAEATSAAAAAEVVNIPETTIPAEMPPITEETVPAAAEETTAAVEDGVAATEETSPVETTLQPPAVRVAGKSREPVMELPEVSGDPSDFFSDAAFIGDSISYSLFVYQNKTGALGKPLFLVRGNLSLHNTLNNVLKLYFQGKEMGPWEALAASGAGKVFIMLGTNDIGYYGIDETMEYWAQFLAKIREQCPDIQIYIQSLTPMWTESEQELLNNANIDIYNQRLEAFSEEQGCRFVNIAPYFKDSTNGLAEPYSGDRYVHMREEGVAAWVTLLRAYAADQIKEST